MSLDVFIEKKRKEILSCYEQLLHWPVLVDIPHRSSGEPPGRVLGQLPVSVEEQLPSSLRVPVLQPAPKHLPSSSRHSSVLQLRHVLLPKSDENRRETDKRPADRPKHTHEEGFHLNSVIPNIFCARGTGQRLHRTKLSRYDVVDVYVQDDVTWNAAFFPPYSTANNDLNICHLFHVTK